MKKTAKLKGLLTVTIEIHDLTACLKAARAWEERNCYSYSDEGELLGDYLLDLNTQYADFHFTDLDEVKL